MADDLNLSEEEVKAVEKAIGEPFMEDFSENTLRIRRNLLATASVALIYKLGNLQINEESSFFGVKLDGLTSETVDWALFSLITYLTVHFLWNSISHFHEWRLRLSGSKVAFLTAPLWAGEHEDAPRDPRQSTLYTFLLEKRSKTDELEKVFADFQGKLDTWDTVIINAAQQEGAAAIDRLASPLDEIKKNTNRIKESLSYINRIPESLSRFERWFKMFRWNQSARWLVLEWALPLALGGWALVLVMPFWQSICL